MKRFIAVISVLCLIVCSGFPIAASDEEKTVGIASFSDVHYLADSYCGNLDSGFDLIADGTGEEPLQQKGILDSALAAVAADGYKYLLISGDLSLNGELESHKALAAILEQFEADTGVQVLVINGNHDINRDAAKGYISNGDGTYSWKSVSMTSPERFKEIYKDLGYDLACSFYEPPQGEIAGMLSYSVRLDGGYRLIAIDAGKYSSDNTDSGLDIAETGGNITGGLMNWILSQISEAKAAGEIPIAMTHWNLSSMNYVETSVLQGFTMDNWREVGERFAEAGLHYVFTGHSHANDISSVTSDNGETLYSIMTGSLSAFPNMFRENDFTASSDGKQIDLKSNVVDCDKVKQVVDRAGNTYERPYRLASAKLTFTNFRGLKNVDGSPLSDAAAYAMRYVSAFVLPFIDDVAEAGLLNYIGAKLNINIEATIDNLLHGGIRINDGDIFTAKNVMSFLNDLAGQITERYITDPDHTMTEIQKLVSSLVDIRISDIPFSKYYEEYGIGSPADSDKGGTLGDAFLDGAISMALGNEDMSDDAFMTETLVTMKAGSPVTAVAEWIKKDVVKGFLENDLLSHIKINLSSLIVSGNMSSLRQLLQKINLENASFLDILDMFSEGVGEGSVSAELEDLFAAFDEIGSGTAGKIIAAILGKKDGISGQDIRDIFNQNITGEKGTSLDLLSLINLILSQNVTELGSNLDEVAASLLNEYFPPARLESIGTQASEMLRSMAEDENPVKFGDHGLSTEYNGPVEVIPTEDDFRLPVLIAPSFGNDPATQFNISWYSKYSLTDTDIEIISTDGVPEFTGIPTKGEWIETDHKTVPKKMYGLDLGEFALLPDEINLVRHSVRISGLTPGAKYYYRVGNARRGWWSKTGSFTTSDGRDGFSFIHVTDTLNGSATQYSRTWGNLLRSAYRTFPDTGFVLNTGDMTGNGDDLNRWKEFFGTGSNTLMNTAIMPAAGDREAAADNTLTDNFLLDIPEQDTKTGAYYSFDYNSAHIAVLNTNDLTDNKTLSAGQIEWLRNDMQSSDAMWKIVAMHKGIYSDGKHASDKDVSALRGQLAGLMSELDVDLVLEGHDRVYYRTDAIDNNTLYEYSLSNRFTSDKKLSVDAMVDPYGTVYVNNSVSGSYPERPVGGECAEYAATDKYMNLPVFSYIRVEGEVLFFKAYATGYSGDAIEIDSFGIKKSTGKLINGDVNFDGSVNAVDARLALRKAAKLETLAPRAAAAADVDGDLSVTSVDARLILRAAAGLEQLTTYRHYEEIYYQN